MALDPDDLFRLHEAFRRWERGRFQATGIVNSYWTDYLDRDPLLQEVSVCVELVIGEDTILRVSNRPTSTTSSSSGRVYRYHPILQEIPTLVDGYALGTSSSQSRSITLQIPNRFLDVASLIRQGKLLAGVAEVSFQVDGGDYDQRLVWLRGDMADGVTFGAVQELVEVGVSDPRDTVDVSLPPFIIDGTSWGAPADSAQGQRYALVPTRYDAVPCWWVDAISYPSATPSVVVCIGHLDDEEGAVVIEGDRYSSTHPQFAYSWDHTADALGVPVTTVRFTGSARTTFEFTEQVYAYPSGGPCGDHPLEAVRFVVERFTAMGTSGVSDLLFSTALAKSPGLLARLLVNAGGASNTTSLAYLEGEFLASFPMVSMIWHGTGYGPVVTDRRSSVIAWKLNADQWPVLDRASMVTETPKADCYNDFTLQYAYDPVNDAYTGIVTKSPRDSILCSLSLDQIGNRPREVLESPYIHDEATARAVVDWMVDHLTFPTYVVQYHVAAALFILLRPGDNVTITDPEFGWESVVATVEGLEWSGSHATLTLRVWWRYYTLGTGAASFTGKGPPDGGQGGGNGGQNPQPGGGD